MTDIHIPGHGWWYAVTVIDDYSRYLLTCHFTPSYRAADVNAALDTARTEAERLHGALTTTPLFLVTDNGPSFLARAFRRHIDGDYTHIRIAYRTPHSARSARALPPDAQDRGGVLEALYEPRRGEAVTGGIPPALQRGPSALGAGAA